MREKKHISGLTIGSVCQSFTVIFLTIFVMGMFDLWTGRDEEAPLPWNVRHRVAVGVAEALTYIQDGCPRPVIHRDVKASNILLTEDFEPRVRYLTPPLLVHL